MIVRRWTRRLGAITLLFGAAAAAHADPAGQFVWVRGTASVTSAQGVNRVAVTGDPVNEGDTIRTGADGLAQIRFADRGILSVRADTELELRRYSAGDDVRSTGSILMNLARGGVRSVTGLIGKLNPAGYMLETPTAILGVRGTDHETHYVPPPPPGTTATIPPGTYDRVYEGATVLRTATRELELRAGQTGFVGHGAFAPQPWAAAAPVYRSPAEQAALPVRSRAAGVTIEPPQVPVVLPDPVPLPPIPVMHTAPRPVSPLAAPVVRDPERRDGPPVEAAPRSSTRPVWEVLPPPGTDAR